MSAIEKVAVGGANAPPTLIRLGLAVSLARSAGKLLPGELRQSHAAPGDADGVGSQKALEAILIGLADRAFERRLRAGAQIPAHLTAPHRHPAAGEADEFLLVLRPGSTTLPLRPEFEHAVVALDGDQACRSVRQPEGERAAAGSDLEDGLGGLEVGGGHDGRGGVAVDEEVLGE